MKQFVVLGAAALLTACAPTNPHYTSAEKNQGMAMAEAADKDLVCEYEQVAGSLRRQRVCRSKAQLAAQAEESRKDLDKYQRTTRPELGN